MNGDSFLLSIYNKNFLAKHLEIVCGGVLKLSNSPLQFFFTFAEGYNLTRENPEGLQLIAAILYQDMSGLKRVSLGPMIKKGAQSGLWT